MNIAIIVALLAVGVNCQGKVASPACKNECAIDALEPIKNPQVQQLTQIIDGAAGPKVAKLVGPVILNLLQKLPLIKKISPAAYRTIIQLLKPCGLVEKILTNGKPVVFTPKQQQQKAALQKRLTPIVGPNTACFVARIITIASGGLLSNLETVVKLINLVLCIATNPTLVKTLQPVLKIVTSLLSKSGAGNPLVGLGGTLNNRNPLESVKGILEGTLGGLNKCFEQSGIKLNRINRGIL